MIGFLIYVIGFALAYYICTYIIYDTSNGIKLEEILIGLIVGAFSWAFVIFIVLFVYFEQPKNK